MKNNNQEKEEAQLATSPLPSSLLPRLLAHPHVFCPAGVDSLQAHSLAVLLVVVFELLGVFQGVVHNHPSAGIEVFKTVY